MDKPSKYTAPRGGVIVLYVNGSVAVGKTTLIAALRVAIKRRWGSDIRVCVCAEQFSPEDLERYYAAVAYLEGITAAAAPSPESEKARRAVLDFQVQCVNSKYRNLSWLVGSLMSRPIKWNVIIVDRTARGDFVFVRELAARGFLPGETPRERHDIVARLCGQTLRSWDAHESSYVVASYDIFVRGSTDLCASRFVERIASQQQAGSSEEGVITANAAYHATQTRLSERYFGAASSVPRGARCVLRPQAVVDARLSPETNADAIVLRIVEPMITTRAGGDRATRCSESRHAWEMFDVLGYERTAGQFTNVCYASRPLEDISVGAPLTAWPLVVPTSLDVV